MSNSPAAFESKAIFCPSGDQRGVVTIGPWNVVSCKAFDPSLLHVQISGYPERRDPNAILFPSDENWGILSLRLEKISRCGSLRAIAVLPTVSGTAIFSMCG
jgi:hypothetical protein